MKSLHRNTIFLFLISASHFSYEGIYAQNLAPNHDFEYYTACPPWLNGGWPLECEPWDTGSNGSPDYFHVCALVGLCSVPHNVHGYQAPLSGEAYTGIAVYGPTPNISQREYIQAPLTEPLQAGVAYWVSFSVNLGDIYCGIRTIGALFTEVPPPHPMFSNPLDYPPQIESHFGFMSDTGAWTNIYGCFLAEGGEAFITIGNFHDNANTPLDPSCTSDENISYYYIEDVFVEAMTPTFFNLELGGPVMACGFYEIDPDFPDAFLTWSDGSHGPTLTVTESGTYSVTIADGCSFAEDEIEVTIITTEPIDIGPEEFTMCEGEVYNISLDPDGGSYLWNDGTMNADYAITTSGVYSVTLDDGCNLHSDSIDVTVIIPPGPIDLGDDQNICEGETITLSVDPAAGDITWHDNSTSPTYTITTGGNYAVTISNACGIQSDDIEITDLALPDIDLPDNAPGLCVGSIYDISIDPSLGDILWSDGSTESYFVITETGMYAVSVTNQCGTGTDAINVQFYEEPVFDLGMDVNLCPGDTLTLGGLSIAGQYHWQDGSADTVYTITGTGTYALTITNDCDTGADTITVTYDAILIPIDLGPDLVLCPGEQVVLQASAVGANYIWQDASTADSIVVTAAGTYFVQVYNACYSFSDTIIVTATNSSPSIDLPDQLSLCQGQSVLLESLISGVNYLWSDNSTASTLTVNTPGTYSLTVSNNCGTDADSVIIADGGPAPIVDLGNDLGLCPGQSHLITPTFTAVDTWLWSDGSTGSSIEINGGSTTSVIVSNSCGTSFDTLITTLLPAVPVFSLGPDTAICSGETVALEITLPDVSIEWSDGSTAMDFELNEAGQYFATIANSCGEFTDTIIVLTLPDVPALDLGNDLSLCPGELIIIEPGIPGVDYLWHDGSTGSTFSTTQAASISLTISNECGTVTDTLEIVESTQGPQVDLGADITGCVGEEIIIQSGISGVDYVWQDGSTGSSYETNVSGQIILNVSNNCGSDADTLLVELSGVAPWVELGADTLLCDDESLSLEIVSISSDEILWQDGSANNYFEIKMAGVYHVFISNACGDASDTIQVDYLSAPEPFDLGNDTVLCAGESIILMAPVTSNQMQWQDGSSDPTFIANAAQTYSLQISNLCGVVSDAINLTFVSDQPIIDFEENMLICPGDMITLDAAQPFTAQYVWSTGATSSHIEVVTPGTYAVTIITDCGEISQAVDINASDACTPKTQFYIPNIFSPNGDGLNDVFEIHFNSTAVVESISGQIFDRWGNLLFASQANPFTWDGTADSQLLNAGVFVYRFTIRYSNGVDVVTESISGDVTIVRYHRDR